MTHSLNFAFAHGEPTHTAVFRKEAADFIVRENLGFTPEGEGEHLYVHIEKTGENTQWVADKLAKYFSIKSMDVGFSGMKDRNAITSQWFSLYLPRYSGEPDWQAFIATSDINVKVLQSGRHRQKLRRGMHQSNSFVIALRELPASVEVSERLDTVSKEGVPNYFGDQRFGHDGNNIALVERWVTEGKMPKGRSLKSVVMSAARSYLFNLILSERVKAGNWQAKLDGEVVLDDQPSAPLWGRGRNAASGSCLEFESGILEAYTSWCEKLEHCGLSQERRSLVLKPEAFSWEQIENTLTLSFTLPAGAYATVILREIARLNNQSLR
ncbi:tRNA pseudouridine synthase D [Thalassocella blandensis]|nr:tRNA pseudouridine synthase D [Thalassocella blandensis]